MPASHIDCTLAEYHARPEWSRSQLEVARESWPLFHGKYVAKPALFPQKQSDALDVGTVAHEALLNPDGLDGVMRVIPREVLNDKGHRMGAAWKQFEQEHEWLILLKQEEADPIQRMVANTLADPAVRQLFDGLLHVEHTLVWTDEETGLEFRCRPDMICAHLDGVLLVDFKTTKATDIRLFVMDAHKYGYHRQAAHYSDGAEQAGFKVLGFLDVAVDKTPAHECRVLQLSPRMIDLGRDQLRQTKRELAYRLGRNDWTAPTHGQVIEIDLPEYAYKDDQWRISA